MRSELKAIRKSRGKSQREVAGEIGISAVRYSQIENGGSAPTDTWAKIQKALSIPNNVMWGIIFEQKGI